MKKSELVRLIKEALNPVDRITLDIPLFIRLLEYAKEDAQTDMDLHDVAERAIKLGSVPNQSLSMKDYDTLINGEEIEEGKPGLWDNIRAKRARGEKPSHGNSKAFKDAVKAGKKINKMTEGEEWPEEIKSRYGEYIFKLAKIMPDRAKYDIIDAETGKAEIGGRVYRTPAELQDAASQIRKPQGGRQSSHFGV